MTYSTFHSFRLKMGLERWTLKNLLFLQRFSSQCAHDSSQLSHFSPPGSNALFTPLRVPGVRMVPRHACEQSAEKERENRLPTSWLLLLPSPTRQHTQRKQRAAFTSSPKTPGNPQSCNRSHSFFEILMSSLNSTNPNSDQLKGPFPINSFQEPLSF